MGNIPACPSLNSENVDSHTEWNPSHWEQHQWAWFASGLCAFAATILSFHLMYKHITNFRRVKLQTHIVRILFMVPVYGACSWFSFRFFRDSVYFDVPRDMFEAMVIFEFFQLLIDYLGGPLVALEKISSKPRLNLPVPLCCINVRPKRAFLQFCRISCHQYVGLRVITTIVALIMQTQSIYCPGHYDAQHGFSWITFINFWSVTVAMYGLVCFWIVALEELRPHRPMGKFLSVKTIIALTFWQLIIVAGLVNFEVIKATTYWSTENISTGIQNFLICIEMLMVAVAHVYAFNEQEFNPKDADEEVNYPKLSPWRALYHIVNPWDYIQEGVSAMLAMPKGIDRAPKRPEAALRAGSITRKESNADIKIPSATKAGEPKADASLSPV